jgi:hypothetical protein
MGVPQVGVVAARVTTGDDSTSSTLVVYEMEQRQGPVGIRAFDRDQIFDPSDRDLWYGPTPTD